MRASLCHLCTDYKTHCPLGYFILKGTLGALHKYAGFQCIWWHGSSKLPRPQRVWNDIILCRVGRLCDASWSLPLSHVHLRVGLACVGKDFFTFGQTKKGDNTRPVPGLHRQMIVAEQKLHGNCRQQSSDSVWTLRENRWDVCLCNCTPEYPGSRPQLASSVTHWQKPRKTMSPSLSL